MKRRNFILTVFIASTIPFVKLTMLTKRDINPLTTPDELSRFCDEKTLRSIGNNYMKKFPAENTKEKLTGTLLTDDKGTEINPKNRSMVFQLLNNKIFADFSDNKVIIIKGWVISLTEARQCALFSLT